MISDRKNLIISECDVFADDSGSAFLKFVVDVFRKIKDEHLVAVMF
ncbi:MAG: hypothetical protein K6C34_03345 [Alphaproteobacteria bacterium]|nr:hypothetical protein [Alphaproteobacteria bacterium]